MNKSLVTNLLAILLIAIGFFTPYYSEQIKNMGLYAFSGAITNWLAIHMLFEKVPGLYGSGIITERFEEFKIEIKKLIMTQFFTQENVKKFMSESAQDMISIDKDSLMKFVDFDKAFAKLKSAIMESSFGGMLSMFGGEAALEPLRDKFKEKFQEVALEMLNNKDLINHFTSSNSNPSFTANIKTMVDGRLNELTPKMVKEIIQGMIKEHLGWLVVWGGVFGALIGLVTSFI